MSLARTYCCLLLLAAACAPGQGEPPASSTDSGTALYAGMHPPAFPSLGSALPAGHTAYDNASLAQLFVSLSHDMEWGARRRHLVRFEMPVSVGLEGAGATRYFAFVDGFLSQIAEKSGVDIARRDPSNLHVRLVNGRQFERLLATAVCVVAQDNVGWEEFSDDPGGRGAEALVAAERLEDMTIFIPDTAPPFQVRNCLLEEIPQALGLANDLFGLGSSIFNDDAAHLWPTKLDYLMLRVLYDPIMRTGLDRRQTEARAREILDRINPSGIGAPPLPSLRTRSLGNWSELMRQVFSRETTEGEAQTYAGRAVTLVKAMAPGSAQHCHTLITAGRVLSRSDPEQALSLFDEASRVCDMAHGFSDIRQARIRLESSCALLRLGRSEDVAALAEEVWPVLAAHGQDERLAALYAMQSAALEEIAPGSARAAAARQLAEDWGAYAFGAGANMASGCRRKS